MYYLRRFWNFLKEDSWQSWVVSLIIMYVFIRFMFFPFLSYVFMTPLPLVVVESCSMYHEQDFDGWWSQNALFYESEFDINRFDFENFPFRGGLNKGDIVFVSGRGEYSQGDIIIFNSNYTYPLIHRLVDFDPIQTKGDHNPGQLNEERSVSSDAVLGKAVGRIPGLGWLKLIFFEGFKPSEMRGFCR